MLDPDPELSIFCHFFEGSGSTVTYINNLQQYEKAENYGLKYSS